MHFLSRKTLISTAVVIALILIIIFFWKKEPQDISGTKPFIVSGKSMEPTIKDGDEVFADLAYYQTHQIQRGDIIAIQFSLSQNKIKRVIAVGGDKVEFRGSSILVNGSPAPTSYLKDASRAFDPARLRILKIQLGESGVLNQGALLVLGDNRVVSDDSQQFGLVSTEQVMGKVLYKKDGWRTVGL